MGCSGSSYCILQLSIRRHTFHSWMAPVRPGKPGDECESSVGAPLRAFFVSRTLRVTHRVCQRRARFAACAQSGSERELCNNSFYSSLSGVFPALRFDASRAVLELVRATPSLQWCFSLDGHRTITRFRGGVFVDTQVFHPANALVFAR